MVKKVFIGIGMLLLCSMASGQRKGKGNGREIKVPMTAEHWSPTTDNAAFVTHRSVPAVRSNNEQGFGIALKDFEFTDGIIEYDVELMGMGFPGIVFRSSKDSLNSEIFYIRYFGTPDPSKRTTLQYASVLDRVNMWDMTDDYQAAATIYEKRWNHIKLVVHGRQMKVYVNDMQEAALHVPALEGENSSGGIELTGNVIYANFKIRPDATEDLTPEPGYDATYNDSRYFRNWLVTEPMVFPFGRDLLVGIPRNPGVAIDTMLFDSTAVWRPLKAERRALVNLTRLYGETKQGERRLAWIKTKITSQKEQERRIDMGFSDEVWVFINGQPLHTDQNYYGSPGMKEPRGRCTIENTSFKLPLQEGENELLIGVTNYFFGWGIIARLDQADGLEF
ncbi:hypothetical protein FK220_001500 [Flavobacteriaceae bacterium TP-CH-4]|uniref:3-keto-alpha-glucoside-1,2-lyase/3-keto-2-hydroxy-glucal hydratase domain-containing protein n=1 Tax=Pelagihabitans pacificus TaxID=2696054 RepID=A0A967APD7_9FLAO|nr:family 16 glycoside hydrolase [Pelagihabitans pacificus]NHF57996.1 hypothetical protein [Pelagihabitans pacificus]